MYPGILAAALVLQAAGPVGAPSGSVTAAVAATRVGHQVVACGSAERVRRENGPDSKIFIDLDGAADAPALTLFVLPVNLRRVPVTLPALIRKRLVCVKGKVMTDSGAPAIELTRWEQMVAISKPPADVGFAPGVAKWTGGSKPEGGQLPTMVRNPAPRYTRPAMDRKITGTVEMNALVGADGLVKDVQILKSLDPYFGLDDEAIQAAMQWQFNPATLNGSPVACVVTLILEFRLH